MDTEWTHLFPQGEPVIALPNWKEPRLLIANRSARQRWRDSVDYPAHRWQGRAYRMLLRSRGALRGGDVRNAEGQGWALAEFLKDCVADPQPPVVRVGIPCAGRKWVMQISDGQGHVAAYVKWGHSETARQRIEHEASILRALPAGLGPKVLKLGMLEGGLALAMSPVAGHPVGHHQISRLTEYLAELQSAEFRPVESHPGFSELAAGAPAVVMEWIKRLSDREWPVSIQHGDLAPWNFYDGAEEGKTIAMDWGYALLRGVPYMDAAYYLLQVEGLIGKRGPDESLRHVAARLGRKPWPDLAPGHAEAMTALAAYDAWRKALVDGDGPHERIQMWQRQIWDRPTRRFVGRLSGTGSGDEARERPMRVLFVHRDLPFHGGVPRCLHYLARAIDPARLDFRLATLDAPSEAMSRSFAELGIAAHSVGDHGYIRPAREMRKLVDRQQIEMIVATTSKAFICAKLAARNRNIPVVFWVHGAYSTMQGWIHRRLVNRMVRRSPMMFVSHYVRGFRRPPGHVGPEVVIHNGVEDLAIPTARERGANRPFTMAFIGEFAAWKDHATAIAAMHEVVRRGCGPVQTLFIGAGQTMESCKQLARSGPAAGAIQFLGALPNARELLSGVDAYIHPARDEGFGLAVVEAMLAERPVVVAREGAMLEYLENGRTGQFFKAGNPIDLADKIQWLMAEPAKARAMGEAGRVEAVRRFGLGEFARSVCDFLHEVRPAIAAAPVEVAGEAAAENHLEVAAAAPVDAEMVRAGDHG